MTFASRSLALHLARGGVGLGALVAAVELAPHQPLPALALTAGALVFLRGCPMCWTLGLVETLSARLRGRGAAGACSDGGCDLESSLARSGTR